jgi:hypothetical protein
MAGAAIYCRRLYIIMRTPESVIGKNMALPADLIDRFIQQHAAWRHMAVVAPQTVPAGGRVDPLGIHPLLDLLMAGQADVGAGSEQQILQFCLVGTMALGAQTIRYRQMLAVGRFKIVRQVLVTGETEGCLVFIQHSGNRAAVRIMADQTVTFIKWRVEGIARFSFHQFGVALTADIRPGFTEDIRVHAAVRDMAGIALSIPNRPVDIGLIKISGLLNVT